MIELIIGIVATVLFSCVILWAYRRGIKDGLAVKDNKPIEPIKTPVAVIHERTEAKETKQAEDIQSQLLANLLSYTGEPQKEVNG